MFPIVDSCSKIVSQTNLTERGYLAHAFGTEFAVQILGFLLFSLVIQRSRGVATISAPCWNPYKNREHREPMTLNAGGGFGQLFGVGKSCEWFLSIAMFDYQRGIAVMNKIWLCLHIWSWRSHKAAGIELWQDGNSTAFIPCPHPLHQCACHKWQRTKT